MNWVSHLLFSFYITNHKKKKKFLKTFCNLANTFAIEMYINRVGVLINNVPAIQFSYKFEFVLCRNCGTSYQDINQKSQLLLVHSVVWSVFPRTVLNKRIHFTVLMLKSSFNVLGATMKSQKWSKNEALGSNYTLKDGLKEYLSK